MEKCKFCQAELEEDVTVCSSCGKDNAESEETVPAEETAASEAEVTAEEAVETPAPEIKAGKKGSPALVAALIVMILALAALMVALVIGGMDKSAIRAPEADQQTEPTQTVVDPSQIVPEATTPEGNGDPASPFCKGSYSAPNDEVLAAKDTVIATAGEFQLTLGELQMYYWQEVSGFLNQYGSYAGYYGLDVSQSLDTQPCMVMDGMTWQQYFLYSALNSWHTYQALDAEAEASGYEMPADYAADLEAMPAQLDEQAATGGFDSAQSLMTFNVGSGPSVEDYLRFMEIYYHGYNYYNDFYLNATATAEEIEAMFAEHEAEYASNGLTKETKTVNVRHILVYPVGEASETDGTYSDEAWAAGEAAAQAILDQWLAGEATEESFAALAGEHSQDPGSVSNGGLYTEVYEGQMVTNFNDWCFDPERQVGDYGIVRTEYGFHIMFYSGEEYLWAEVVEQDVISTKTNDMVEAALEKYPLTVSYDKILLSLAEAYRAG